MRINASIAALTLASLATATAIHAHGRPPRAHLTMARARAIAVKLVPGKVISSEYEKEGGGWRYSFDIQQKSHVQEIGIDGRTGRVVENKSEGKVDHD